VQNSKGKRDEEGKVLLRIKVKMVHGLGARLLFANKKHLTVTERNL